MLKLRTLGDPKLINHDLSPHQFSTDTPFENPPGIPEGITVLSKGPVHASRVARGRVALAVICGSIASLEVNLVFPQIGATQHRL